MTSELLSQTGPDKWEQSLASRSSWGCGMKLRESQRPWGLGLRAGSEPLPGLAPFLASLSWDSPQFLPPSWATLFCMAEWRLYPMTPSWAQAGMAACLLSIMWMSTVTSDDMCRADFIPLNLLLLHCPLPGCFLLTTFHQWPNLPLLFFFFFLNLFIYFWLCWVLVAAHGLSLVAEIGGYSSLRCAGFSLQWLLLLRSTGSRCAGFGSCGTWAQ